MAVTIDSAPAASGTSGATTWSVTVTAGASVTGAGAIVGACPSDFSGPTTVSAMTYDGNNMEAEVSRTADQFTATYGYSYGTTASGSKVINVTVNESSYIALAGFTVQGGDSADPVTAGNTGSSGGSGTSTNFNCVSVSGELVVGANTAFSGNGNWTASGPTEVSEIVAGGNTRFVYGYIASSGTSQAFNGDWTSSGGWSGVAMSFKEGATGNVVQSAGAATVTAASAKLDAQPVSSAGASTVVARGQANSEAVVAAAGQAAANLAGSAQSAAPVSSAGAATVNIEGNASAAGQTAAQAAGVATVNITGSALAAAEIQAAGEADVRVVGVPTGTGQDYLLWGSRLREDGRRRTRIEQEDAELIRIVKTTLGPELIRRARR